MKREEAKAIFTPASIDVLDIEPLIDGYGFPLEDSRFFLSAPRLCWWFVKTNRGWIKLGWRNRVIHIEWKDTDIRKIVTEDNVTKNTTCVHAWIIEKAIEYLRSLFSD